MTAERIDFENLGNNPIYKDYSSLETSQLGDIKVDVLRLIKLTERYPVTKIQISDVIDDLDSKCWIDGKGVPISPREVIEPVKQYGDNEAIRLYPNLRNHIERITSADITFPIHIYNKLVLNGSHRLASIVLRYETGQSEQDFVVAKVLQTIPEKALIK